MRVAVLLKDVYAFPFFYRTLFRNLFEGIQKKGQWWQENFEVHGTKVSDPVVADNHFAVTFWMDTTHKPSGQRSQMNEIAVYQVKEGKIWREQFFYNTEE